MEQTNVIKDSQSSVELASTSKGTNITVKCYNLDIEVAERKAQEVYERLLEKYSKKEA